MSRLPGPSRRDGIAWAAALVGAVIGTLVALAADARLGTALTVGVIVLVAIVLIALATERSET